MHPLDCLEDWTEQTVEFMVATNTIRIITEWWTESDGTVLKRSRRRGRPLAHDCWRFPCTDWSTARTVPAAARRSVKRFIANVEGPERAVLFEYVEPCKHPGAGFNQRRRYTPPR